VLTGRVNPPVMRHCPALLSKRASSRGSVVIVAQRAPAANNLAWNYAHQGGNIDIALSLAQRARELDSNNPVYADTLGWIQYKKGSYGMALEMLKESNEKYKSMNPTILYHLGLAYQKTGDNLRAKESLTKALAVGQAFSEADEARSALSALKGTTN
jgi:tetratricopeptide (TPR) repeat protein